MLKEPLNWCALMLSRGLFSKVGMSRGSGRLALLLFGCVVSFTLASAQSENAPLEFIVEHRVNAHGDEFNALAKSSDGKRAYIATEKGNIIVWNLTSGNVERTLHQPSAVHLVMTLSDPHYLVAAGSNHHSPLNPLVRKWNVENGTFENLPGLANDAFPIASAHNDVSGLIAVAVADGTVIVWDVTNKAVANFKLNEVPIAVAIVARQIYVAALSREAFRSDREPSENLIMQFNVDEPNRAAKEFLRIAGRFWEKLECSPDQKLLVATFRAGGRYRTVMIEPRSKTELSAFDGSTLAWIDSNRFVGFDGFDPDRIVQLNTAKKIASVQELGRMQNDIEGRAFELTGQIVNADGTKAWAVYRKGPGFLEFDLQIRKIKTLIDGPSSAYAISVITKDGNEGVLATGGADGYVRIWNLSDLALIKEHHVVPADGFVTDVDLVNDGRRAVVGVMRKAKTKEDQYNEPVQVVLLDLTTGTQKKLLEMSAWQERALVIGELLMYPSFDRMKLISLESGRTIHEFVVKKPIRKTMLSSNQRWLGVLDDDKTLALFEVASGNEISSRKLAVDDYGPMVITNDGRYVYQVGHEGKFLTWDTQNGEISERVLMRVREMSTNVDFVTLANDDKWLVTAGNHGDVGVFERATGNLVCYEVSGAAAFYAEKAWLKGDRLIFTTDAGVMFDGRLVKTTSR